MDATSIPILPFGSTPKTPVLGQRQLDCPQGDFSPVTLAHTVHWELTSSQCLFVSPNQSWETMKIHIHLSKTYSGLAQYG